MKKLVLILTILILTGCSKDYSKNLYYMDTVIKINLYDVSETEANSAFNEIEDLYKKYESIVNYYDVNSELYKLNHNEDLVISDELINLIKIGEDWYNKSNGLLNINIGSLTKVWHDFRNGEISLPSKDMLDSIDITNNLIIENNRVSGNINIDLGSIAKGYVTELAGKKLEEIGIKYYIINAGGNVKTGSSKKEYYKIGIASPNNTGTFKVVKGSNISVVTSGGYERFMDIDGVRYHHIIDPKTKYPANYVKSVTVIGIDSGVCDALSTILFLMDVDSGKEFIKDYDVDVIWYTNDDNVILSDGFKYE